MKIATICGNKICTEKVEDLKLEGKGAIIRTSGCGLCGSDIIKLLQKTAPAGTVLGHEVVGEIVEIDSETDFKIGDRIASAHHIPCFKCIYCRHENYSMCQHFKETNIKPGGFSELIYLSEEHLQNVAVKIPKNLTEIEASFYEPLGCCVRSIKRAEFQKGDKALVVGLGSIGLLMGQAIKAQGVEVYSCDLIKERIDLATELGLNGFNSLDIEKSAEFIKSKTEGLGVDAVFMTSGSDIAIELALKTVRSGGKIIIFASTPKNHAYPNNEIYYRELTVLGSYSPAPADLMDSMELLKSKKVKVDGLSTVYEFEKIEKAFRDTIENNVLKAYVKIN